MDSITQPQVLEIFVLVNSLIIFLFSITLYVDKSIKSTQGQLTETETTSTPESAPFVWYKSALIILAIIVSIAAFPVDYFKDCFDLIKFILTNNWTTIMISAVCAFLIIELAFSALGKVYAKSAELNKTYINKRVADNMNTFGCIVIYLLMLFSPLVWREYDNYVLLYKLLDECSRFCFQLTSMILNQILSYDLVIKAIFAVMILHTAKPVTTHLSNTLRDLHAAVSFPRASTIKRIFLQCITLSKYVVAGILALEFFECNGSVCANISAFFDLPPLYKYVHLFLVHCYVDNFMLTYLLFTLALIFGALTIISTRQYNSTRKFFKKQVIYKVCCMLVIGTDICIALFTIQLHVELSVKDVTETLSSCLHSVVSRYTDSCNLVQCILYGFFASYCLFVVLRFIVRDMTVNSIVHSDITAPGYCFESDNLNYGTINTPMANFSRVTRFEVSNLHVILQNPHVKRTA